MNIKKKVIYKINYFQFKKNYALKMRIYSLNSFFFILTLS